jgi:hypothetical protein
MRGLLRLVFLLTLLLLVFAGLAAQKYSISGHVIDARNGESLIGVGILPEGTTNGVITNSYGFYSISLPPGNYDLHISYLGYSSIDTIIDLQKSIHLDFEMSESVRQLQEVVIKAERARENVTSTQMSAVTLSNKAMKQIPVAFGEADVLKTIVMLPGVKTNDEGGSTISVRGGGRDQNLIILDEATVYNASHMGNLLSVFNNDAILNVEFFKGNMPAQYGGRLSSVIDMRMKEGNRKKFGVTGGIGTLSSRLTLEGPIVKDRGSFFISGRRAYIDILTKAIHTLNDSFPHVPYYFYDLNMKANYDINKTNRIFISGYFGKDVFEMNSEDNAFQNRFSWGNYTGTLRWNSIMSEKLFTNLTLLVSNYNYAFGNTLVYGKPEKETSFDWTADLLDYSFKYDIGYYAGETHTVKAGLMSTWHNFNPGRVTGNNDSLKYDFTIPSNQSLEHALYLSDEYRISDGLSIEAGIRYSLFQNMGKTRVYLLDDNYKTIDTAFFGKGDIYNHYQSLEPRISLNWKINGNSSVKAGYCRTSQYVHVASNSNVGSLIDIWVGSGINVKPQLADLYSIGYFRNLKNNSIETSVEVYYKDMYNQIEFREFATPQFNERMDEDFRFGIARSYGLEVFIKKSVGKLNGWVSYTWSKTERKTKDIQEKGWYLSAFDRPHDLSVVGSFDPGKRLSFSMNFQLKSGRPFTSPVKRYEYDGVVVAYYAGRNNDRMPVYHRLDVGVTWRSKDKPGRRFHNETTLSVFDVYNRSNPISIYFRPDEDNENVTKAYAQNFLGFMPAITWNFTF